MSKYTMELRELFEPIKFYPTLYSRETIEGWFKEYNIENYLSSEQIETIEDMGIWNKNRLATEIVDHYYMREIAFETPMLFHHYVKVKMQEIMGKYLPLIYSASIEYNPLINENYTETFTRTATNEGNSNNTASSSGTSGSNSTSSGLNVASDTPQGQISKTAILSGNYASSTSANENSITDSTNTSTSSNATTSSDNEENEEYTREVKGNRGISATYQKMIEQYRDNIISINQEIIDELGDLFMLLY